MPVDRFGEPWSGATYRGFSGAAPHDPTPATGGRRLSRGTLIGGVAAAVLALGLALGFALRPDNRALSADDRAEAQVTQHMPIQVDRPAPPPALPKPAGKLEVMNPATAQAARAAQPVLAAAPAPRAFAAIAPPATAIEATAPLRLPQAGPATPTVAMPPPAADPAMRCVSHSRAEALVCADPELASYDRDLNRAYRRAMRSGGVSPDDLRADQRDWLDDRERAARRSPEAMAELYQQRIEELNRIADAGPG